MFSDGSSEGAIGVVASLQHLFDDVDALLVPATQLRNELRALINENIADAMPIDLSSAVAQSAGVPARVGVIRAINRRVGQASQTEWSASQAQEIRPPVWALQG